MIKTLNQQEHLIISRVEKRKWKFNSKRKKRRSFYKEAKEWEEARKEQDKRKMKD